MTDTTQTELESKLARLAELKAQIEVSKPLTEEFKLLKVEVQKDLNEMGADKTKPYAGIFATIVRKVTPYIADVQAAVDWLKLNGYPESDYMTPPQLDVVRAATIGEEVKANDGEVVDWLKYNTTESLSVFAEKRK